MPIYEPTAGYFAASQPPYAIADADADAAAAGCRCCRQRQRQMPP
jgi:hypothetical protein